jgi:hypothetical protein
VTITSAGADTIYYTVDGTTPTVLSNVYSAPVVVAQTETLKALAVKAGSSNSTIGTASYVISASFSDPLTNVGGRSTFGVNWVELSASSGPLFSSFGATSASSTVTVRAYMSSTALLSPPNDQSVSFTFSSDGLGATNTFMIGTRFSTPDGTKRKGYFAFIDQDNSEVSLRYINDATSTNEDIGGGAVPAGINSGSIWNIQAVGTTISVYFDGTLILQATDNRATSGTGYIELLNSVVNNFVFVGV